MVLSIIKNKEIVLPENGQISYKDHWNNVYTKKEIDKLGWYESSSESSIKLLIKCHIDKEEIILDVGSGASKFIDYLVEQGYKHIIAADISETALNKLKVRLGQEKALLVHWIVDDLAAAEKLTQLNNITLWHDRAVLHFLTEAWQRQAYFSLLKQVVKNAGYVIISAFSLTGKKKCSGLDIRNYDQNMLAQELGVDFELIEYFDYTYQTPSGEVRPYIYTLFQRTS